jgi:pimeloyl-ACP methyl ester carboxylesterase
MADMSVVERAVTGHDSTWTYLCAGKGPPVVWLHGLWGEPGWDLHHQRLAERYTVYAPALPGYHGSSFPQWLVDCEDAATLLIDFLEALKLERPILMGHSLGGWIAAEAAIFRPLHLTGLVLVAPLGIALDWTQAPNIFYYDPMALPRLFFADPALAAARRYVPPPSAWDERLLHNREASMRLAFQPYLHSRRLKERLRFIEAPTLIVWGEQDKILGAEHAREWQARLPRAQAALISAAGHFPHVERPEACLPTLIEFLDTLSAKEVPVR